MRSIFKIILNEFLGALCVLCGEFSYLTNSKSMKSA